MSRPHEPGANSTGSRRGPKPWVWLVLLLVLALLVFGLTRLFGGGDETGDPGASTAQTQSEQTQESQDDEQGEGDENAEPADQVQPVQLTRGADGLTVETTVPDENTKASLLAVLRARAGGTAVNDRVTVAQDAQVADFAGLLPLLAAGDDVSDLDVRLESQTVTVRGTATDQAAKSSLEAAATRAFPRREVTTQITAPAPTTGPTGTDAPGDGATTPAQSPTS